MQQTIFDREMEFIDPKGNLTLSKLTFNVPYQSESGEWRCDFSIPNIEKQRSICGIDSLQAVTLAISFSRQRVENLIELGWQIRWPNTTESLSASEAIP